MHRYYFDANATIQPLPSVIEVVTKALVKYWGNPTSTHKEGQKARGLLEEARYIVANNLNVAPNEIIFCSSATEALHLLFKGLDKSLKKKYAAVFPGEHSACLNQLNDWEKIIWLPTLNNKTETIVQMAANNETGIIYNMPSTYNHTAIKIKDSVQAWGKINLNLNDCDAAVLSGHKIGSTKGVAVLWIHSDVPWETTILGPQEHRKRGGTENLAAILGLAEAIRYLPEQLDLNSKLLKLRNLFEDEILSWSRDYEIIGKKLPRLPNTSSLLLRGFSGVNLQIALDLAGFAVSTGSACHSGIVTPSHAIKMLGFSDNEAKSVLRISMLPTTKLYDIEKLLDALRAILKH